MSTVINWCKSKIKSLELTWSDFFLGLGFLCFVPFAALSWLFMVTQNPHDIFFKPWMMIVCFTISVISLGIYFYLEIKRGNIKNNLFLWVYILFAILSVVSVLVQPRVFEIDVEVRHVGELTPSGYNVGDIYHLVYPISWIHKMFFTFASLLITTVFYILIIVFPKRLKNLNFLIFMGICVFFFLLVLATYSYITEADKYARYVDAFFHGDTGLIQYYAMKSFITHRVPYGVCMMLGVMFALVLHGFTKKWYWSIPIVFCYVNMFFSYCKTSLALSALAIFVYVIFELVRTIKKHKVLNITILSAIGAAVLVVSVISIISIASKGKFISQIYRIYDSYTDGSTTTSRFYIWKNIQNELSGGWWILGRGFGTHNYFLYPMNRINNDDVCPSHSSYYAVMGAGGIFNLIGFIGVYAYFAYIFYKCFKVNKVMTLGLSIGFFTFFLYSFTEGVNYLIVFFVVPLAFYFNQIKNSPQNVE